MNSSRYPVALPHLGDPKLRRFLEALRQQLQTLGEQVSQPACRVWNNSSQTITNKVATALAFDSETFDVGGMHSTSSNNSRITIPVGHDGVYLIQAQVSWVVVSGLGKRQLGIRKNGSTYVALQTLDASAINEPSDTGELTSDTPRHISSIDQAAAGDYYELMVYHNAGANRTVASSSGSLTWFGAAKLLVGQEYV